MLAFRYFRNCPTAVRPSSRGPIRFAAACGLTYFFNPTVAAAAFHLRSAGPRDRHPAVEGAEERHARHPRRFRRHRRNVEDALAREVKEEVNLEIADVKFLLSEPNLYEFKNVTYPVCDMMFTAIALNPEVARALDGASEFFWARPEAITVEEIAFPSVKKGLLCLISTAHHT